MRKPVIVRNLFGEPEIKTRELIKAFISFRTTLAVLLEF